MLSIIKSIALNGLNGYIVNVQVDVSSGIPSWDIVGLPDPSIKESKERVRTAIKNTTKETLSKKIVVNLAPADIKKEGSFLDLPIAIGTLVSVGKIRNREFNDIAFVGELSLNGDVNGVYGILPICIEAKKLGIKKLVIPYKNLQEASILKDIEIYGVRNLLEVLNYLNNNQELTQIKNDWNNLVKDRSISSIDFSDVKGQENAKRGMEIAAAGAHNCLLIGSPGSGKTMLANRIPTILPDLTFDESLEITKIYSIAGKLDLDNPIITSRPFRNPHHTISNTALIGGGKFPKPGEISLANYGVLFLDEFPEFKRSVLEQLRSPIEDKKVTISRVNGTTTYPCKFMLVVSMNPCPCGHYGSNTKKCTCNENAIKKYMSKISGPLLDRIDIQIETQSVPYQKLNNNNKIESSEEIKQRVNNARKLQLERYSSENIFSNSELTPRLMKIYCKIDNKSKEILERAFNKLGFSARAYTRILKVARTIADLDNSKNIETKHIAEAIQYRMLDKKYF